MNSGKNGLALLIILTSVACSRVLSRTQTDPYLVNPAGFHSIHAYGRQWKQYVILTIERRPILDVFRGGGNSPERENSECWLENDVGVRKLIGSNIEVLQNNGNYRLYSPQNLINGHAHRVNIYLVEKDNRIFILIEDDASLLTDAPVHPPNEKADHKHVEGKLLGKPSIFIGELDPDRFVFRVSEFVPSFGRQEFEEHSNRRDFDRHKFYLEHRKTIPSKTKK